MVNLSHGGPGPIRPIGLGSVSTVKVNAGVIFDLTSCQGAIMPGPDVEVFA